MKTQIREVIDVDHDFPSSGQDAGNGQHKQVTFQEAADIGTGATGVPILGAQTEDGAPELVYTDEGDNDVQITNGGYLDATSLGGVYPAANVAAMATMMNLIYPIGFVITLGVSTNPNTLLGVGTWTAIEGKVIVGIAGSGTFDTLDATGGAETHTIAQANLPNVNFTVTASLDGAGGAGTNPQVWSSQSTASSFNVPSGGSGTALATMDPYIVKYVWQRTA
jgi:hypothetical protein